MHTLQQFKKKLKFIYTFRQRQSGKREQVSHNEEKDEIALITEMNKARNET